MTTILTESVAADFIAGDKNAFDSLFRKYYSAVCYYVFKMTNDNQTAEDIASASFEKLWNARAQINNPKNLQAYLYAIAKSQTLNWIKREKLSESKQEQVDYLAEKFQTDSQESIIHAETMRLVMEAVEGLPGQCKKIMKMYYEDGKNTREIAEELGLRIGTIKTQKARGIELLKKRLGHSIMCLFI